MAFTAAYGADGHGADDSSTWMGETASALREAGFKIVRFGAANMMYVGQVDYHDKPSGHGYLFLANGDLHECDFVEGRAMGDGLYLTAGGTEMRGRWEANKRVGIFQVLDGNGVKWVEKYSQEGNRVGRKKVRVEQPNPAWSEGCPEEVPKTIKVEVEPGPRAFKCWSCNSKGRDQTNHAWACRAHQGRFTEDHTYTGTGPRPGVWSCCGREQHDEPGCTFRAHKFMEEE